MKKTLYVMLLMILLTACDSKDSEILEGYNACEEYYSDGFQDYVDYCKYFYRESDDEKFKQSVHYSIVTKENIDEIKKYFSEFPYEYMEDCSKYDFEINDINEGDYYCLKENSSEENYSIFLFEVKNHILYYIHYNV
ncbi:hypothetical protein [uncultured Eubacterium sp.]|uniref:hypothetical protein n=1 Tax=uncultured Eubacterium sp. TaxID=165185 RepID=UPI002672743E|nr:hypothetical protein [uncultured Eubacterium sp.]